MITLEEENIKPAVRKVEHSILIICKIALSVVLGNFCQSLYPVYLNVGAFCGIVFLLTDSLRKDDPFSFLIQVFFLDHFITGDENGGIYNLAAVASLLIYYFLLRKGHQFFNSTLGKITSGLLLILVLSQLLAMVGNDRFGASQRLIAFLIFVVLFFLIYNLSLVDVQPEDFSRFFIVMFVFSLFILFVSVNQRLAFSTSTFLPNYNDDAEFEFDFIRSGGTFLNYEAYGEYSLSMVVLLLPGLMTGTLRQLGTWAFMACIGIFMVSLLGVVLSGTRSSFFLLPIGIAFILLNLRTRIKLLYFIPLVAIGIGAYYFNDRMKLIDIDIFEERSSNMDLQHLSLNSLLTGNEMNRGEIFSYAFNKIERSGGMVGEGYFTKVEQYKIAHFDSPFYPIIDYHNFYLSSVVLWGFAGALAFICIFLFAIVKGVKVYYTKRKPDDFRSDLLLGFNTLFIFFMINQYKIQFIRESSYMVLIFILLILYKSIVRMVENEQPEELEPAEIQ